MNIDADAAPAACGRRVAVAGRAGLLRCEYGYAFELKQALLPRGACGTVVELCRQGEGVEVALDAEQQEDGGFFFAALWVLAG